jgi:UDP:flavonoid glycosyltransferase YjiC (YdhE family)
MKILLVTRGSQGDVYPYIGLARRLQERGHTVSINVPYAFEPHVAAAGVPYTIEGDDVVGLVSNSQLGLKELFEWVNRVIEQQVHDLVPMLSDYDVFVASNTEFAAPSIAEYTHKPLIRTAYAPLLPSKHIMPPMTPLVKKNVLLRPWMLWGGINHGIDMMCDKTLNAHRVRLGLPPMKSIAAFNPANAFNLMMYSPILGEVDERWPYPWGISGYCFNDTLSFSEDMLERFMRFIHADGRPTLFYSLGSINGDMKNVIADWLLGLCKQRGWKLVVGAGWWKTGENLPHTRDVFLLDSVIPHNLILHHCAAIIHHGGAGTTHSSARAGRPQMVFPHVLDQYYWGLRTKMLGLGPGAVKAKGLTPAKLEAKVIDLMTNPVYRENAARIGESLRAENGLDHAADAIERFQKERGDSVLPRRLGGAGLAASQRVARRA